MPTAQQGDRPAAARGWATLVAFARPHTITGTVVSLCGLFVLARSLDTGADPGGADLLTALVGGLAVNVYIVGLNQLTDVALDRVNKPWLPLAAGTLSRESARLVVAAALALALAAGALGGPWLLAALATAAALGTAYSARPLRLKRFHPLAAGCIVAVRGLVVNLLVFAHYAAPSGAGLPLPPALVVLTLVVVVLGLVIAWFKDLGDMEGDRQHAVGTLALRLGPRRVVRLGVGALLATYAGVAVAGPVSTPGLHGGVMAAGHGALAVALAVSAGRLDLGEAASTARFYRSVWWLFSAEYVLVAVAAVLG